MRRIADLTVAMLVGMSVHVASAQQSQKEVDLEALYQQIDEAIDNSPVYVAEFEKRLNKQKDLFMQETDTDAKLLNGMILFEMYRSYKNDSALHYIRECITLADSLGHYDIAGQARSKMARQCSNSGMYVEAAKLLDEVDTSVLSQEGLTDYYDARSHLCGEIANYSLLPDVKAQYGAAQQQFRDSLEKVADKGSDQYLNLRVWELISNGDVQEALKISNDWINKVGPGTREDAMASYFRHIVYAQLQDSIMVRYWLGRSALADIKCAVMDQASLITLAHMVNIDGDMERSYKYIRFTWDCNSNFNTRMRSNQISPVLGIIERNYQDSIDRNSHILTIATIVFIIFSLLLVSILYYVSQQKKKLAQAKSDLTKVNEELSKTNHKLKWTNDWVTKSNKELFEINEKLKNAQQNPERQEQ